MEIHAFDTETVDGYARIISTELDAIEVNSFNDIIIFFKNMKPSILWTFNLRYDAQAILKYIPIELLKELYETNELNYNGVNIFYIPSKMLVIRFSKRKSIKLYDIAQFYNGSSLDNAAKSYLIWSKVDDGGYINKCKEYQEGKITLKQLENFFIMKKEILKEYCRADCELTLRLAKLVEKAVLDVNATFRNPISQASLVQEYINTNYNYPMIPNSVIPYEEIAEASYYGGIFSTLKRGLFYDVYDYDINSAYPFIMSKLPHWANGKFKFVESDNEIDTNYGWFECEFNYEHIPYRYDKIKYEPVVYYKGIETKIPLTPYTIIYPKGKRTQIITKLELEFLLQHNYEVKVKRGIVWEPLKNEYISPFSWIEKFYNFKDEVKKLESKNSMKYWVYKIFLNSGYGKTAQSYPKRGKLTNFFYASYITAGTRVMIMEVLEKNRNNIIEIATDGILSEKKLKLPLSGKMGEWEEKEYKQALIVGSGIRQMWNKEENFHTKARGITNTTNWDMLKDVENNLDKDKLLYTKIRPISLGEVLMHNKILSHKDLNVFTPTGRLLSVNTDKKRLWEKLNNFKELLDRTHTAEPINI